MIIGDVAVDQIADRIASGLALILELPSLDFGLDTPSPLLLRRFSGQSSETLVDSRDDE